MASVIFISFTEIYFIDHKIHLFKNVQFMDFSVVTDLCNHHYCLILILEHFYHSEEYAICPSFPSFPALYNLNLLLIWVCLFWTFTQMRSYDNEVICDWLPSSSIMFAFHNVACISTSSLFMSE